MIIIKLSDIGDIQSYIKDQIELTGEYYRPQFDIECKTDYADFLRYCEQFSEYTQVDGLGGKLGESSFRRYPIPDKKLEDVIHMSETGIKCGIQITPKPIGKIHEWDSWEGGYIEGFIRMDADDGQSNEWFVWQYIKMDYLEDIVEEFNDKLITFKL